MSTLTARILDGLATVALAPACPACGRLLDSPTSGAVCPRCWGDVRPLTPPVCDACGDPLPSWRVAEINATCRRCTPSPRTVDRARAASNYEGRLRDIIHAFKYDGRTSLSRPLAALMQASGRDILDGAACAIPVPLHPWRRLTRGFNQSAELARHLGIPVVHALWRVRPTRPQAGLTAAGRRINVRGRFSLSPWLRRPGARARWLDDRTVLLVDDVRTTGATLDACALVLRSAGVREVRALTLARAAAPAASWSGA